jgi:CBS-domain-containing membrane protein
VPFTLEEFPLLDASVPKTATFSEAARTLAECGLSTIAVLDDERHVVGFFTEDDLIAGLFPRYLRELRHTAFAQDDESALAERAREAHAEPVARYMSKPATIEIDTSATHVAERFLHVPWGAIAVLDADRRFIGMLTQNQFARHMLARLQQRE